MIVLFEMGTMTKAKEKNITYQSYLSYHYLPSEKIRSLMLKPHENKYSLMPLLHAAGCIVCQGTNLLLRI